MYTITIDENTPTSLTQNGLLVGKLTAADADAGSVLSYTLAGGTNVGTVWTDKSGAFTYDSATGEIRVLDASKLRYEKSKAIKLAFAVADNGIPGNTKPLVVKATVVVALTDRKRSAGDQQC